mmetsp:Transcript_75908/g.173774  ORF Transcript_75908/g.173774 Transcript_75908/m.173774 type:complete len:314 (-) Transcript_75908:123-1064(-)
MSSVPASCVSSWRRSPLFIPSPDTADVSRSPVSTEGSSGLAAAAAVAVASAAASLCSAGGASSAACAASAGSSGPGAAPAAVVATAAASACSAGGASSAAGAACATPGLGLASPSTAASPSPVGCAVAPAASGPGTGASPGSAALSPPCVTLPAPSAPSFSSWPAAVAASGVSLVGSCVGCASPALLLAAVERSVSWPVASWLSSPAGPSRVLQAWVPISSRKPPPKMASDSCSTASAPKALRDEDSLPTNCSLASSSTWLSSVQSGRNQLESHQNHSSVRAAASSSGVLQAAIARSSAAPSSPSKGNRQRPM